MLNIDGKVVDIKEDFVFLHRGSYMSALILLNLLNELGKRDTLSLFRNEFNKFNNTRAQMLDSIVTNLLGYNLI